MKNKLNKKSSSIIRKERFTMKKMFLCVLALAMCVSAAESLEDRVDVLQAQIDRAMARAGIHFNGEFRSQFLNSRVDGSAVRDDRKLNESVEYTSVDFDIVARPNTALSARAMFRLHQDWRNFFSDVQNPITSRWLSIDGSLMDGIIKYNLGDYTKKMSPLTLWSPDFDFLYEPEIFAADRRFAMSEAFLGDNNRLLQGMNIEFSAELYPLLSLIEASVFGARLAASGDGETGVLPIGIHNVFDKYLLGFNLGTEVMPGLSLGVSDVMIFEHLESSSLDSNTARLTAQSTNVAAGRMSVDNRVFMDDEFIRVGLKFEGARSSDRRYRIDDGNVVEADPIVGMAINAGLFARVAINDENEINLSVDFINNEADFRNEAAQTPIFFQRDIMNFEQGFAGMGLSNPFDAMYRTVFKYSPSQYVFGGPLPLGKYAYNNAIVPVGNTDSLIRSGSLSVFQSALPGGMATANRTGPVIDLKGSFLDKGVTAGVKFASLKTMDGAAGRYSLGFDSNGDEIRSRLVNAEFTDMAFGVGLDIAKFVPAVGPSLKVSGSIGMYDAKYVDISATESSLLSLGLDYNFAPRFSILAGYQQLVTDLKDGANEDNGKLTFGNTAVGLGYRVADGGTLVVKLTMTSGKLEPVGDEPAVEYSAFQPEVFLRVKF
jgi:hypothetical protein